MPTLAPAEGGVDDAYRERREDRWGALAYLWQQSALARQRTCRKHRISTDGRVVIANGPNGAYYRNLQHCGSVHSCPICAVTLGERRANEIRHIGTKALELGKGLEFVTMTVPHHAGQSLDELWRALSEAWRRTWAGRVGQRFKADYGIQHSIKAVEVTLGPNGWHPHLHVLLITARPWTPQQRALFFSELSERWCNKVEAQGLQRPKPQVACKIERVAGAGAMSQYLTKVESYSDPAAELARGDRKRARGTQHRTVWMLLDDCWKLGEVRDRDLWREYETTAKGKRRIQFSDGLRAEYGVDELTDEELLDQDQEGGDVAELPERTWREICDRRLAARVLTAAELHGFAGVRALLAAQNLDVDLPNQQTEAPPP